MNKNWKKYEREVTINFNAGEDVATLYSSDAVWIRKMDKIVNKNPNEFRCIRVECDSNNGAVVSKYYSFPKKLITIRGKTVKRDMTDEQKQVASERLKKARKGTM